MPPEPRTPPTPSTRAIGADAFRYEQARHLLARAAFAGTPAQIRALADWGPRRAVDFLLSPEDVGGYPEPGPDDFDADIMTPLTEEQRRAYRQARLRQDEDELARFRMMRQQRQRTDRRQMAEMRTWWLRRMIETPRPLEEVMTLFWHGHFATSYRTIENSYHMYLQNCLFRAKGLGSFEDLLRAVIRDPAMLAYLDNDQSRKGRPNENLARELMELFSLGEGNYTERDIKEGARALTGYTYDHNQFRFRRAWHDAGTKSILGKRGPLDGDGFVDAILDRPECAEFICAKLYRFFVGPIPGDGEARDNIARVVRALAATFRSSRYDVRAVLRELFLSEHFYDPYHAMQQIKSPAALVVGAIRSLHTPARDLNLLADALDLMGQNLFFPPSVKGWDGGRAWINTSTLFVRQNVLTFLLTGRTPTNLRRARGSDDRYDPAVLLDDLAQADPALRRDPDAAVDYLLRLTLGPRLGERHRETLRGFLRAHGDRVTPDTALGLLCLITAAPEYQLT